MWGWSRCALDGLIRDFSKVLVSPVRNLSQSVCRQTVVVERWWQVPLSEEGRPPRLHPRRHQVYRLVEDTKHGPREKLELILTQTVPKLGGRGDVVFVKKSLGRNKLLPEGLAVYASPENRQMFEEERRKLWEGKPEERVQTRTGELTVQYLKRCHLEVGMKNNVKYELTKEIVCRQLLRRVNGLETVRIPMSVVNFMKPKTRAYKNWLKKEQAESQDSNPDETGKEDS
ncbi:large ribosomal subunit protein bL9m isoform X2 [Lepisosteus oculatus]|uniref:large ribosomal subunit protein bL9m isoform X2 n=1 Tax=Lepisosteus oculatus TaxID=7918 RepID=UPI003717F2AE